MTRERLVLLGAILGIGSSLVLWVYACMRALTYPWEPDTDAEFLAVTTLLLGAGLGTLWWVARKDGA